MADLPSAVFVRQAFPHDAGALADILNSIIQVGGTTAMEIPLTSAVFDNVFIGGEDVLACHVAEDTVTGEKLGFQAISRYPGLPHRWADIATFARQERRVAGVGTALFHATRRSAEALSLTAMNAAIRADNRSGLAFYGKMGFRTYRTLPAVPLRDGTLVDRILKRYDLIQSPEMLPNLSAL